MPIFAHFINNGSAVVIEFLHKREIIPIGHQEFGSDPSSTIVLMSALVTILICFIIYRAKDSQKEQEQTNT